MADEPEEENPGKKKKEFRIREFPDLRLLRAACRKHGANPRPEEEEEDFGLKRSTTEEALKFLCDNEGPEAEPGPALREFLDDDE